MRPRRFSISDMSDIWKGYLERIFEVLLDIAHLFLGIGWRRRSDFFHFLLQSLHLNGTGTQTRRNMRVGVLVLQLAGLNDRIDYIQSGFQLFEIILSALDPVVAGSKIIEILLQVPIKL